MGDDYNGGSAGLGTYPCHVTCLKMLARAIVGTEGFHQLDIYSAHRAMHGLSKLGGCALNVDYGDKAPLDQFWESYPGEEVRGTWLSAVGLSALI